MTGRDLDTLQAGLAAWLSDGARMTGLTRASAGHSNETYFVEGLDLVLRMPPSDAPLIPSAHGMRTQFDLFAAVHALPDGPPVPAVRQFEDDPAILGAPFFLMERLTGVPFGDYAPPDWALEGRSDDFRGELCRQAVTSIALLHRHAPLDTLGPVQSPRDFLQVWRHTLDRFGGCSRLDEAFTLLEASAPAIDGNPTACHGDPKLANMLWNDGKLVALIDWEMAFNGDPRSDLAYLLGCFAGEVTPAMPGFDGPGFWTRAEFIAEWERLTGRHADRLHWFEAANWAKLSTILMSGYMLYRDGLSSDERYAAWEAAAIGLHDLAVILARMDAARLK